MANKVKMGGVDGWPGEFMEEFDRGITGSPERFRKPDKPKQDLSNADWSRIGGVEGWPTAISEEFNGKPGGKDGKVTKTYCPESEQGHDLQPFYDKSGSMLFRCDTCGWQEGVEEDEHVGEFIEAPEGPEGPEGSDEPKDDKPKDEKPKDDKPKDEIPSDKPKDEKPPEGDEEHQKQLALGVKTEKEHEGTIRRIMSGEFKNIEDVFTAIAEDHLKEIKDYYTRLSAMEKTAKEASKGAEKLEQEPPKQESLAKTAKQLRERLSKLGPKK